MKKFFVCVSIAAAAIFIIDWLVIGLKILDGNYDFLTEMYIALACIVLLLVCAVYKITNCRCPYCGKTLLTNGKFCPNCGKEIQK